MSRFFTFQPTQKILYQILVCTCGSAMIGCRGKPYRYYYTCNQNCKQGREAFFGNMIDITERNYLEKKVIDYEELCIMKSDLLAMVSYELRTPP